MTSNLQKLLDQLEIEDLAAQQNTQSQVLDETKENRLDKSKNKNYRQ